MSDIITIWLPAPHMALRESQIALQNELGASHRRSGLPAFAVKHVARDLGPLVDRKPIFSVQPCSFTSKAREASLAACGNTVYVLEVRRVGGETTYWLGYRYVARHCVPAPAGPKWHGRFEFKNEADPPPHAEGLYFDSPIEVTHPEFVAWYKCQVFGMVELPPAHVAVLDALFSARASSAKRCA